MAVRCHDQLLVAEVREWVGGRLVTLKSQVEQAPGCIDVFRANPRDRWPGFQRQAAVNYMVGIAGIRYGYWSVIRASTLHLFGVRVFARPNLDDKAVSDAPPSCSQALAMAYRIHGRIDAVRFLSDRLTEPADLARSPFFEYLMTLVPEGEKK